MTVGRRHQYIATPRGGQRIAVERNPHRHSRRPCDPLHKTVGEFRRDVDDEQNRQRKVSRNLRQNLLRCADGPPVDAPIATIDASPLSPGAEASASATRAAGLRLRERRLTRGALNRLDARNHLHRRDQFTFPYTFRRDAGGLVEHVDRTRRQRVESLAAPGRDWTRPKPPGWAWDSWP